METEIASLRMRGIMASLERFKLIERLFSEAAGYLEKGDAVQSSEKQVC
ncbi:MAG: hypothetical protein AOA66_0706 [Candidatus Bathyarchaeota archaeon BA2]|nr:MAG: hypothetical protein AOA66_0706 [Candidatus Bathyarchaeota archaeon BA2]